MDMEIEFLYKNFTERNPKFLMDHIQRMASGEAPFFPATLSLIYDKLVERTFVYPVTPSSSGPVKSVETGDQGITDTPTAQVQDPTTSVNSPSTTNAHLPPTQQTIDPGPELEPIPLGAVWLRCFQCNRHVRLRNLYEGLRCPMCPSRSIKQGKPFMRCPSCNLIRTVCRDTCVRNACQARFV